MRFENINSARAAHEQGQLKEKERLAKQALERETFRIGKEANKLAADGNDISERAMKLAAQANAISQSSKKVAIDANKLAFISFFISLVAFVISFFK